MKRFIACALILTLFIVGFSACVDIDEALPHYKQTKERGPK
jgi:hypothetical protein